MARKKGGSPKRRNERLGRAPDVSKCPTCREKEKEGGAKEGTVGG